MKKFFLLTASLLLYFQLLFAEYAVVNNIVYEVNIGDLTASVLNFHTSVNEPVKITIPNEIVYKNEVYKVTTLSYNAFDFDALKDYVEVAQIFGVKTANSLCSLSDGSKREQAERKFKYEYEEARANIVELNLPSSITHVGSDAFKGMTRLKNLRIPANVVSKCSCYWFEGNSRLENITFEGVPNYCYNLWSRGNRHDVCMNENPSIALDALKTELKKDRCPKLQNIEVLPLKEFFLYDKKLKSAISDYETKLKQHPYYVESEQGYFDGIQLQPTSKNFKNSYNELLTLCKEKYSALMNDMGKICKKQDPELYAEKYCALHPDFSAEVDKKYKDYKCHYASKMALAEDLLQNKELPITCQEGLWPSWSHLFKNKDEFYSIYEQSNDIYEDIEERKSIYEYITTLVSRFGADMYGIADEALWIRHGSYYYKMKQLNIPITEAIIALNSKMEKEYKKNGKYFMDPSDFFDAYIHADYKNILKQKKIKKEDVRVENNTDQTKLDMYYIAYLIKADLLNYKYKKELKEKFNIDDIMNLVNTYSEKELKEMSNGRSKDVSRYRL